MSPPAPRGARGRPRGRPTFNPPRPARPNKQTKTDKAASSRRKSAPVKGPSFTDSDDEEKDENSDTVMDIADEEMETESREEDEEVSDASSISRVDNDPPPTIPPALLSTLVHHHLPSKKTRISKDAMGVVGKYMETFIREAIARAAFERQQVKEAAGKRTAGDDFVEVDDLEKLAPQLLLDF